MFCALSSIFAVVETVLALVVALFECLQRSFNVLS